MEENNVPVKLILIGDSGVGKTCIAQRKLNGQFNDATTSTIGAGQCMITAEGKYGKVSLNLWDTAGQERYRSLTHIFFKDAKIVVIVFDITRASSFSVLEEFNILAEENCPEGIKKIVIGNKSDLEDKREVDSIDASDYAEKIKAEFYMETSARTGINIDELFYHIATIGYKVQESTKDDYHVVPQQQVGDTHNNCC